MWSLSNAFTPAFKQLDPIPTVPGDGEAGGFPGGVVKVARFPIGRIVATPEALGELERAGESPGMLLKRHVAGDWGDVDEDDRRENEHSLVQGCRLLSPYTLSNGTRLWAITEADRSATTILLPSEYRWLSKGTFIKCLFSYCDVGRFQAQG